MSYLHSQTTKNSSASYPETAGSGHSPAPSKSSSSQEQNSLLGQGMSLEEERTRVKSLVRKHVHDVRNYVNCANMEATLLQETTVDQEVTESLASIREQLEALDKIMSEFARNFRHYPDPEDF